MSLSQSATKANALARARARGGGDGGWAFSHSSTRKLGKVGGGGGWPCPCLPACLPGRGWREREREAFKCSSQCGARGIVIYSDSNQISHFAGDYCSPATGLCPPKRTTKFLQRRTNESQISAHIRTFLTLFVNF